MFKFAQKFQASQKKKSIRKVVAFSLVSSIICSSLVFLLAPKKGADTRKDVLETVKNASSKSKSIFTTIKEKFGSFWNNNSDAREKYFETVTQKANDLKDNIKKATQKTEEKENETQKPEK